MKYGRKLKTQKICTVANSLLKQPFYAFMKSIKTTKIYYRQEDIMTNPKTGFVGFRNSVSRLANILYGSAKKI